MTTVLDPLLDFNRSETLIKSAKSDPIPFAFGLGPTPGMSVLAVDKSKTGKVLFEICRKKGGAKKGAYGTVQVHGATALFACEKDDTTDLAKAILAYFRVNGIGLRAELAPESEATGSVVASDRDPRGSQPADKERAGGKEAGREEAGREEVAGEVGDEEDIPESKVFDSDLVVPLIRTAKKKARPFAYGTGPELDILAVHPKLAPVRLAKMVRAEGARKGVWGTVLLDGAVAVFTCEKEPFSGVTKGIKRWLKDRKVKLKFRIEGPDGVFDDPEEGDDGITGLAARLAVLKERLAALPEQAEAIRARHAGCQAAIGAGNVGEAERLLTALETIAEDGEELARLRADLDRLVPGVRALAKDPALVERARGLWTAAGDAVGSGDAAGAARAIEGLREMITADTAPTQALTGQPKPVDARRLMDIWNEAKDIVDGQIGKLQVAFRNVQHPLGAAVADRGLTALTGRLLTGLQVALRNVASAPPADPKTTAALLKAIDELLGFLDTNPALPRLEENPFGVTVTIRATLGDALRSMRDAVQPR